MTPEPAPAKDRPDSWRTMLLPTCREMSRLSSRSLDGPLPLSQRLGAGLHLLFCRLCRRYRKQLRWLRQAVRKPAETAPMQLSVGGRERLKQALRPAGPDTSCSGRENHG